MGAQTLIFHFLGWKCGLAFARPTYFFWGSRSGKEEMCARVSSQQEARRPGQEKKKYVCESAAILISFRGPTKADVECRLMGSLHAMSMGAQFDWLESISPRLLVATTLYLSLFVVDSCVISSLLARCDKGLSSGVKVIFGQCVFLNPALNNLEM